MRTSSLTSKAIGIYKVVVILLLSAFVFAMAAFYVINKRIAGLMILAPYILITIRIWNSLKLMKEISYDESSLYVKEEEFEVQIPFYRIKSVELISLDGVYKFTLRDTDQFGDTVYCKPSIWYPFTYKKVDRELQHLRTRIEKVTQQYWQSKQQEGAPGLPTMNV
ncbi:MAG: hypothetical protein AAFO69_14750 [Bacteroidota bacterium]